MTAVAKSAARLGWTGIFLAAIGLATVTQMRLAIALVVAVSITAVLAARPVLIWWDLLLAVLGGSLVLGYGFANLGVPGAIPVPLADLVALVLFGRALGARSFRWPTSAPFVLAALFVLIATGR